MRASPKSRILTVGLGGAVSAASRGHRLVADHDVGGLEIAVDDAALVGVVDRIADRPEEPQPQLELVGIESPRPALEPVVEGPARHQLHRKIIGAVVGVAGGVDGRDVGVLEPRQRLRLALEHPRVELVDLVVAAHDLEGDPALRAFLLGLPHHSHAAPAELADDPVAGDRDRLRTGVCTYRN